MGDAAHVNSPIGGFGLNSGIHDALDLALRFEGAADGSSREEPDLDQYAQTRREVALSHIRLMSDRNTRTLSESDETSRTAELDRLAEISADPQRSREWLLDASLINAVRALPLGA
jgi:3-(3-hydroxy-phenyl)propionate hydroxylase